MKPCSEFPNASYSPRIRITLSADGDDFDIASLSPHAIVLRDPHPVQPCTATIRMEVDRHSTVYLVHLIEGIDPAFAKQPYRILKTMEEAGA